MNKIFTKHILLAGMVAFLGSAMQAADYINAPMTVSPSNGTLLAGMGLVDIQWQGVTLNVEDDDTFAKNQVDLSYITVTLNGEVNTAWKNYMGTECYVHHIEYSNEQSGGTDVTDGGYMLTLYLGTMSYFWKGDVNIAIAEGAVSTPSGEINAPIELTYYVKEVTESDQISFTPESGTKFNQGEGLINVSWDLDEEISFNENLAYPISAIYYDAEGGVDGFISLNNYCTIVNRTLVIDISSLEPNTYSLLIPEGAIFIGEDYINLESVTYEFKVIATDGSDTEGVSSIYAPDGDKVIYDLQGRKIGAESQKAGVYIINGKKVLVK